VVGPFTNFLSKDTPFVFNESGVEASEKLSAIVGVSAYCAAP